MKPLTRMVAVLIATISVSALGRAPVKFHSINIQQFCSSCFTTTVQIVVENLAYEKQVEWIYNADNTGWASVPAAYVKSLGDNMELWEATTNGPIAFDGIQFAVLYSVNGQDYWDNNGGEDYYVTSSGFALADDVQLSLNHAAWTFVTATQRYAFFGTVNLRNLAYEKFVTIVYTLDNWASVQTASASYDFGNGGEYEVWRFSIDLPYGTPPQPIDFVIAYEVDGAICWDNNFGSNYHVDP